MISILLLYGLGEGWLCMNQVEKGLDLCLNCSLPPDIVKEWYFNKVKTLGIYHAYEIGNYKIPINILSELISLLKFKKKNLIARIKPRNNICKNLLRLRYMINDIWEYTFFILV